MPLGLNLKRQRNIFLKRDKNEDYLRGKYYQWRAHLIGSPDGKTSPLLYNVHLNYTLDLPPKPPLFLEVAGKGDRFVRIKWKKNVDSDIYGYRIYYGVLPEKFDGVISTIGGKRINNSMSHGNFIEVKLTNGIIDENRNTDDRKLLTFPFLRNNVLYYFAVSAYDSYKPGSPYNHESGLSKIVSARPYLKSEID